MGSSHKDVRYGWFCCVLLDWAVHHLSPSLFATFQHQHLGGISATNATRTSVKDDLAIYTLPSALCMLSYNIYLVCYFTSHDMVVLLWSLQTLVTNWSHLRSFVLLGSLQTFASLWKSYFFKTSLKLSTTACLLGLLNVFSDLCISMESKHWVHVLPCPPPPSFSKVGTTFWIATKTCVAILSRDNVLFIAVSRRVKRMAMCRPEVVVLVFGKGAGDADTSKDIHFQQFFPASRCGILASCNEARMLVSASMERQQGTNSDLQYSYMSV